MLVAERILLALASAHVVAGALIAILPLAPALHSGLVTAIFGAAGDSKEVLFLVSAFGPTVASWGILFFALARAYFRGPAIGSWRALVWSVVVWVGLDSALCIQYGLYFAVALNLAVAAVLLGTLFSVRGLARRERAAAHGTARH